MNKLIIWLGALAVVLIAAWRANQRLSELEWQNAELNARNVKDRIEMREAVDARIADKYDEVFRENVEAWVNRRMMAVESRLAAFERDDCEHAEPSTITEEESAAADEWLNGAASRVAASTGMSEAMTRAYVERR